MALLANELPFDAFVEDESGVTAYIDATADTPAVAAQLVEFASRYKLESVREQNRRAELEICVGRRVFAPAEIGDFLRIRAPFHAADERFAHELVIVPEMSFGTGHHETTFLMCQLLHEFAPFGKTVFDFGTGTGILAMYAAQLGAAYVIASDNDERCVSSTLSQRRAQWHQARSGDAWRRARSARRTDRSRPGQHPTQCTYYSYVGVSQTACSGRRTLAQRQSCSTIWRLSMPPPKPLILPKPISVSAASGWPVATPQTFNVLWLYAAYSPLSPCCCAQGAPSEPSESTPSPAVSDSEFSRQLLRNIWWAGKRATAEKTYR